MSDSRTRFKFRLPLYPALAAVVAIPTLAGLGFWQLDRAAQKEDIAARFAEGSANVVALTGIDDIGGALREYRTVTIDGHYDGARQVLLDAMTHGGHSGYQVMTPLVRGAGQPLVLINRGWVPAFPDRARLPQIDIGEQRLTARGRLAPLPRPGMRLAPGASDGWPRVMLFPTQEQLDAAYDEPLSPGQVLLDPQADEGFVRDWQPEGFGAQRHIGYAAQWFALALTLLVIVVVLGVRKGKRT